MGLWGALGKGLGAIGAGVAAPFTGGMSLSLLPSILGAGGAAAGAMGQSKTQNRDAKFSGQMDLERLLMDRDAQSQGMRIDREKEGREGRNDAWRAMLRASRTLDPGAQPQLSPYSIAPRMTSDTEKAGAQAMLSEVMKRLEGGNPIPEVTERPMSVDPRLLDPSKGESILGGLGAGLSAAAPLLDALRRPPMNTARSIGGRYY